MTESSSSAPSHKDRLRFRLIPKSTENREENREALIQKALEQAESELRRRGTVAIVRDMAETLASTEEGQLNRNPALAISVTKSFDRSQASVDLIFDPEVVLLARGKGQSLMQDGESEQYRSRMVRVVNNPGFTNVYYSVNRQSERNPNGESWMNIRSHASYMKFIKDNKRVPSVGERVGLAVNVADFVFDFRKKSSVTGELSGEHDKTVLSRSIT